MSVGDNGRGDVRGPPATGWWPDLEPATSKS